MLLHDCNKGLAPVKSPTSPNTSLAFPLPAFPYDKIPSGQRVEGLRKLVEPAARSLELYSVSTDVDKASDEGCGVSKHNPEETIRKQ